MNSNTTITRDGSSWAQVEHQPREHAVPCRDCLRTETWSPSAVCDNCTAKRASRAQLTGVAGNAKQARLLDLAVQYVHTVSNVGKGIVLTQVAELLPELRTVEQVVVWDELQSAVFAYEFEAGTLTAVETALAAT